MVYFLTLTMCILIHQRLFQLMSNNRLEKSSSFDNMHKWVNEKVN